MAGSWEVAIIAKPKATQEERELIFKLCHEEGISYDELEKRFDHLRRSHLRQIVARERKRRGIKAPKYNPPPPPPPTERHKVEFTQDGQEATAHSISTRIKTLEQLLEHAQVDLNVWKVKAWTANVWEQHSTQDGTVPLYQVKAHLVPNNVALAKAMIEDLREDMRQFAPSYPELKLNGKNNEAHMLEISIPDLHFGRWGWEEETGEHYDMDEAESLFFWAVDSLLAKSRHYPLDRILLPIGNDLFNADNPFGTTTKGTPQDMHGRHRQHFRQVRMMVREAIDKLQVLAPVDVIIVSGNHDKETMYYLGEALGDWYWKHDRVHVDNAPMDRKYHLYGRNLLGFTHGEEIRADRLPLLMAAEDSRGWLASEKGYREWHIGHGHRKKEFRYLPVDEFNGVRVRVIPSLCAADSWHYQKGFVKGVRAAEAYVWHKESGLVALYSANIGSN